MVSTLAFNDLGLRREKEVGKEKKNSCPESSEKLRYRTLKPFLGFGTKYYIRINGGDLEI